MSCTGCEPALPSEPTRDPVSGGWSEWERQCAGPISIDGLDEPVYAVVSPGNDAKGVRVSSDGFMLSHNVRLYLATRCALEPSAYVAWSLPGKTLSFTMDLDGAGCGCNVAPYMVSMHQNRQRGSCSSDYCALPSTASGLHSAHRLSVLVWLVAPTPCMHACMRAYVHRL